MKEYKSIYKMATKAFHSLGDISNDVPDICSVYKEDDDNFYGTWVYGLGFMDVRFPKETTRDLTPEEIEEYHGKNISLGDMISPLNLKEEDFTKNVTVTKKDTNWTYSGKITSPLKVNGIIVLDYGCWSSSRIEAITHLGQVKDIVQTRNSVYTIEYLD